MTIVLKTKHIIMLSKLVSKMNVKLDFKETDAMKLGTDIVMDILENIHLAETEVYELIGSLSGLTTQAVAESPIEEIYDVLSEVVKQVKNFIRKPVKSIT